MLKRDQYECRECKRYGRNRIANTVHHCNPLETYPELSLISWNLVSLCGKCHDAMHDRTNDTLTVLGEYWREKVTPHTYTLQSKKWSNDDEGFFPHTLILRHKGVLI
nr:HNH endonuclease [Lysinibacillus fusiformis]